VAMHLARPRKTASQTTFVSRLPFSKYFLTGGDAVGRGGWCEAQRELHVAKVVAVSEGKDRRGGQRPGRLPATANVPYRTTANGADGALADVCVSATAATTAT